LLPPACGGCGKTGVRWCADCQQAVRTPAPPLCSMCGRPIHGPQAICSDCKLHPPGFSKLRSWAIFAHPVRRALHELKYRRNVGLAEALVPDLAAFADRLDWQADVVVPVPLGADRLRERGYNQVGLISWPLSLAMGIGHASGALRRTRETSTQVGLSRAQRHENVRGAFAASPKSVDGRLVLLLDDVATTGATLSSCAAALFAAGAQDVFALTVARAHRGPVDGAGGDDAGIGYEPDPL
jgi:ComF family protein